jgi:hypothetical protein
LYSALWTVGAAAIVASAVPLSFTATALSEISYSLVILAAGAFVRSHRLKSFRPAFNWARYDLTALLLKSIFLPCGGLVLGLVLIGAPLSWTTALVLSTSGPLLKASAFAFGRGEPPKPNATTPKPIDENISSDARIFFIGFCRVKVHDFQRRSLEVKPYFAEKIESIAA